MLDKVELEQWRRLPQTARFLRLLTDRFRPNWLNLASLEELKATQGQCQVLAWVQDYLDGKHLD